jgi:hypothetical protein
VSGNRSSRLRKRALRRLSHEEPAAYSALYEQVLSEIPGITRHRARPRAWTLLRRQFPDRYLELFAREQAGIGAEVPPDIASKAWQRASARLADLRGAAYLPRYAQFRAQGMTAPKAYERAIAAVRVADADLFARLLAQEYQMRLAVSGAAAPAGETRPANGCERAGSPTAAAATRHGEPASGISPGRGDRRAPA